MKWRCEDTDSVSGVSGSDEAPENNQTNLQLPSALLSFKVTFSS